MWKSVVIGLILCSIFTSINASDYEVIGLMDLLKNFLPLYNTELVMISDFNNRKKVNLKTFERNRFFSL